MYAEPEIISLDSTGKLCAIKDERGNIAGTGTREVCEVMLHIISKQKGKNLPVPANSGPATLHPNVHAAMKI